VVVVIAVWFQPTATTAATTTATTTATVSKTRRGWSPTRDRVIATVASIGKPRAQRVGRRIRHGRSGGRRRGLVAFQYGNHGTATGTAESTSNATQSRMRAAAAATAAAAAVARKGVHAAASRHVP
jgi:hypothetical protein